MVALNVVLSGRYCPIEENRQIITQRRDRVCFSVKSYQTCPKNCVNINSKFDNVPVICGPIDDPVTKRYINDIESGKNVVINEPAKERIQIKIPTACGRV